MLPTLVRADDLTTWADRVESASLLPELVRRLLLATARPQRLGMRTEAGVYLPGFDGTVHTSSEGLFWSSGASVWELSVSGEPVTKCDRDYRKRTTDTPPGVRASTAYVFVTPRRWSQHSKWSEARNAAKEWANVRVLDADDLAAWCLLAPAVALWFASSQYGRAIEDESDLQSYMDGWSRMTNPQLPIDLPLLGREQDAEAVRNWLKNPAALAGTLIVADETRDDALTFAAAVLAPDASAAARSVVVSSEKALRWHVAESTRPAGASSADELVILTTVATAPAVPPNGIRLIRGMVKSEAPRVGALSLSAQRRADVAGALVKVGMDQVQADRMALEAGARLAPLRRMLGLTAAPLWLREVDRVVLQALLLAGAWEPGSAGDRRIISVLGADSAAVDIASGILIATEEAPLVRRNATYTWRALGDAWKLLLPAMPLGALDRLERAATEALGFVDPAMDLPSEERIYANIRNMVVPFSKSLRDGLAQTLARVSLLDAELRPVAGVGAGSGVALRVVRAVLTTSWSSWGTLNTVLPTLAEAAPDMFVRQLFLSIQAGDTGVVSLLSQINSLSNPTTGLLWALERLAWVPQYLDRVCDALCLLAEKDTATHNHFNRPIQSLRGILLPWRPQSSSTSTERLRLIDRAVQRTPTTGWGLLLAQLDSFGMLVEHPRPEYIGTGPTEDFVSTEIAEAQLRGAHSRALTAAGTNGDRLAALLERSYQVGAELGDELGTEVLEVAMQLGSRISQRGRLWTEIRNLIHVSYIHRSTLPADRIPKLESAYQALSPESAVERVAWLFGPHVELPDETAGDYESSEANAKSLRVEKVLELLQVDDGWKAIAELAASPSVLPGLVAQALMDAGVGADGVERFLARDPRSTLRKVGAALVAQAAGLHERDWLLQRMQELVGDGREDDALDVAFFTASTREHWQRIDAVGGSIRARYWSGIYPYAPQVDEEVEFVLSRLLEVGRPDAAVSVLGRAKGKVSSTLIVEALNVLLASPPNRWSDGKTMAAYNVGKLLGLLDVDADLDDATVTRLEIGFLEFVREYPPNARLYIVLGKDAEGFVGLVCRMYRAAGEAPHELSDEARRAAEAAHAVLQRWNGYPGYGLPAERREEVLRDWSGAALRLLVDANRAHVGAHAVAKVLARAPAAADGIWPCSAARELLELPDSQELSSGLETAKRNLRGSTTRDLGDGGTQEHDLARKFQENAERVRASWPATADLLGRLSESYLREADRQDDRAEATRDKYDLPAPRREAQQ